MILMHNKAIEEVLSKELNTSLFCVSEDFFKTVPLGVEHLRYTLIMPVVVFLAALGHRAQKVGRVAL
jgi:hypothetical protein